MKSAFGMQLTRTVNLNGQPMLDGVDVVFWKDTQGWCGSLQVSAINFTETLGSASPEACYRSLRGRVRNLAIGLKKLGILDGGK